MVEDVDRLRRIQLEWSAFTEKLESLTPFQLPQWLITWWEHFGSGKLRCFLFRDGEDLVGVIPCFLHEWNGARQMTLLGTGISDYLEPAIRQDCAPEVVQQMRSCLTSASDWDRCDWQDLSCRTPLRALASEIASDVPCMAIPLEGSFEEYWNGCAKGLRKNLRRDSAKAQARGAVRFGITRQPDEELLDGLIEMHRARWGKQNLPGMIDANGSAPFLRDVARIFAERGWLRIFSLLLDDKLVAMILAFAYRGRISNYLTAFDPAYEHLGFGRMLLYEAIRFSFQNGDNMWDFLRGAESYKAMWRAREIERVRLVVNRKA